MNKIILAVLFISLIGIVSAGFNYDDYELKWQFCNALNFTEIFCDQWWGEFADFPVNETHNINLSEYMRKDETYNMSEIDEKLTKLATNNLTVKTNLSELNLSELDLSSYVNDTNFKSELINLRDSLLNSTASKEALDLIREVVFNQDKSSNVDDSIWLYVLGGVILLVGGYIFTQKRQETLQAPVGRPTVPRIQSRSDMEKDKEIEELKKQIKETPKKTKETTIEDLQEQLDKIQKEIKKK